MAKIQITESELKQIIRESVEGVLNERQVLYGADWEDLSDDEKENALKKYKFNDLFHSGFGGNKNHDEQMAKAAQIYNRKLNRKRNKYQTAGLGTQKSQRYAVSNDTYNGLKTKLNTLI